MPIVLTNAQTRFLRGQAHGLKAILQVGGKGISQTLVDEVIAALEHHELIKVKIAAEDRDAREALARELATSASATWSSCTAPASNAARSCCHAPDPGLSGRRATAPR